MKGDESMRDKKVSLVTGGAGFIGSHVADHCLALGHRVVVLDDLSGGFADNVPEGADLIIGSICDTELVENVFQQYQPNYVYHLAAYAAEGLSHFIRRFNYENNVIGSMNVINAAVNSGWVERFVFTSSIAVYGKDFAPWYENAHPRPIDPYGIAKYAVEMDLRAAHDLFGLSYTIFRMHNVYGERQNTGDPYRNVIGIFMKQVMDNQAMTIFGDGLQTRQFTHIGNVAPIVARSVTKPAMANEIYNVGSDEECSVACLAELVAEAFGVDADIEYLPARHEAKIAYARHDKIREHFPGNTIPLEVGLKTMATYVKAHGVRTSKPFEDIEVTKNLPPSWVPKEAEHGA